MRVSAHLRWWRAGIMLACAGGLWLAASQTALAETPPALELPPTQAVYLTDHAQYLADPNGALTIADLRALREATARPRFRPLTAAALHPGLTTAPYWLRVRIPNPVERPLQWTLLAEAAYLDHLDAAGESVQMA